MSRPTIYSGRVRYGSCVPRCWLRWGGPKQHWRRLRMGLSCSRQREPRSSWTAPGRRSPHFAGGALPAGPPRIRLAERRAGGSGMTAGLDRSEPEAQDDCRDCREDHVHHTCASDRRMHLLHLLSRLHAARLEAGPNGLLTAPKRLPNGLDVIARTSPGPHGHYAARESRCLADARHLRAPAAGATARRRCCRSRRLPRPRPRSGGPRPCGVSQPCLQHEPGAADAASLVLARPPSVLGAVAIVRGDGQAMVDRRAPGADDASVGCRQPPAEQGRGERLGAPAAVRLGAKLLDPEPRRVDERPERAGTAAG